MAETREVMIGEAARTLGLSPQRVRQLVDAGRLPARRGPYRFRLLDRAAVEQLAKERERQHDRRG